MTWTEKYLINGFFGWENFKWLCRELLKVGSNEPSFFSKKRITEGVAFFVLQFGAIEMLSYLINKAETPMSEFAIWAGIELLICGYTLNKIEAAKGNAPAQ